MRDIERIPSHYVTDDMGQSHYVPQQTTVRCSCGCKVVCYGFTNECKCGELYNFAGQHLAPCEQWDYDTYE